MKTKRSLGILSVALVLVVTAAVLSIDRASGQAAPAAKGHEYAGTTACKMCHSKGGLYEAWTKTAHAQAWAKLPEASQKDPKCLGCHATGAGKPGGFDPAVAATTTAGLNAVGCEGCHGPGKDYKAMAIMKDKAKAEAAGLIMPTAKTCEGCHAGTFPEGHKDVPKFDFATMLPKVAHPQPAPAK